MNLFEPVKLGRFHAKNHFARAATKEQLCSPGGHIPQEIYDFYEKIAQGGTGTIIVSSARVKLFNGTNPQGLFRLDRSDMLPEYKKLSDIGHKYGCTMIIQATYSKLKNIDDMNDLDLERVVKEYGEAAKFAEDSGFDGVEIHEAHGSWMWLATVLKPAFNHRQDEYGTNRSLLSVQIIKEIRRMTGDNFIIISKVDGKDIQNGYDLEMSIKHCISIEKAGVDLIEVSGPAVSNSINYDVSFYRDEAIEILKNISIPVMLVGGNRDLNVLHELSLKNGLNLFSISRGITREFDLINRWANGDVAESQCISCGACSYSFGHTCPFNESNPFDASLQPIFDETSGKQLRDYDLLKF